MKIVDAKKCFTALDIDLFSPKVVCMKVGKIPIVFDLGCISVVTPHKEYLAGKCKTVQKTMTGLSTHVKIEAEGTVL